MWAHLHYLVGEDPCEAERIQGHIRESHHHVSGWTRRWKGQLGSFQPRRSSPPLGHGLRTPAARTSWARPLGGPGLRQPPAWRTGRDPLKAPSCRPILISCPSTMKKLSNW